MEAKKNIVMVTHPDISCEDGCAYKNLSGKCDKKARVFCHAKSSGAKIVEALPIYENKVYLRVDFDFANNTKNTDEAMFYYSNCSNSWQRIEKKLSLTYKLTHFTGYRFALFNFATKQVGGYADFDFFRIRK